MASKQMQKAIFMLVYTNKTQRAIAKELDMNECSLSRWLKTDEAKQMKATLQKEFIQSLVPQAMQKLRGLLGAKSEFVQMQAVNSILDRTGYKPTDDKEAEQSINVNIQFEGVNRDEGE